MLQAILHAIEQAPEPVSLQTLSAQLAIEPQALQGMLEYLIHKGRLQIIVADIEDEQGCTCGISSGGGCPGPARCPFVYQLPRAFKVRPVQST